MDMQRYKSVMKWADALDGIFTISDLKVALDINAEATLYRVIAEMTETGELFKVKRGIYATPQARLTDISSRINPGAYISTGTVLAKNGIIGSVPARRVQAVKIGRPRMYRCQLGIIEHFSIAPKLYFGFSLTDGILTATPEKAFLDVCYFNFRGRNFSFDPWSDIHTADLDEDLINRYLVRYDSRFIARFKQIWGAL